MKTITQILSIFAFSPLISLAQPSWIDDGLVGNYPLDLENNPIPGEITNTAEPATDRFGRPDAAARFNPERGTFIQLDNQNLPQGNSGRTVSYWIKPDSFTESEFVME